MITGPVGARLRRPGAGLLVDLDGTLVCSEAANQTALRDYFCRRGWDVPDDVVRAFSGRRAYDVFATVDGPWTPHDPELLVRGVEEVIRAMNVRPEPVPGAARLLAACTSTGLPVAVVTSARRSWADAALESLNVVHGAIGMITSDDCAHGKPDPEPFRRGAALLGLNPAGLVALEDAPAGISSARAAGIGLVIGVTTGYPSSHLLQAGAGDTVADLDSLADAIARRRRTGPSPRV